MNKNSELKLENRQNKVKSRAVQMSDDDTVNSIIKVAGFRDAREIWVLSVIVVGHVHPAIEHNSLPVDRHNNAALANFLSSSF